MFQKARIRLTVWYLLIISLVSIFFSGAFYFLVNRELERIEMTQAIRQIEWQRMGPPIPMAQIDLSEVRVRIIMTLGTIDASILVLAAAAGYFLAGRTLKPISDMVDDQNRFIADASHELRTPLTSLKSEIEVSLRDRNFNLKEAKELLESNLEEVNKLQNLSDNLIKLTQYRKVNGNMVLKKESIRSIINDSVKKVSGQAKIKKINIEMKIKDVKIESERNTLTELFVIFLDNAIKYSPRGKRVIVKAGHDDRHVEVSVSDSGAGISKEEIPHLFERFFRGDKSRTKSEINGYGLGLSIAKEIVDKHKGTISVESTLGKGSTFTARLPLKRSLSLI